MDPRIIFGRLYLSLQNFSLKREEGQTMAEYALTLGLVVLAVVGTISLVSDSIVTRYESILSIIKGIAP